MTASTVAQNTCAVCLRPAALGLVVCPDCGGTSLAIADRLLFMNPPASAPERAALTDRLASLLGPAIDRDQLRAASRGEKALVRLPAGAVDQVTEWLGTEGISTRAVLARRAWAAVPFTFAATLAAVLVAGAVAGTLADRWMFLATPLFAGLLLRSGVRGLARPMVGDTPEASPPPLDGYLALLRATAELRPGHARDLTAALVRAGRSVAGAGAEFPVPSNVQSELNEVLGAAAEAASDLELLDESLECFDQRQNGAAIETWRKGRDELRQARERLAAYLLEATGLVGRLQSLNADAFDSAGERLRELTRELREAMAAERESGALGDTARA